MPAAAHRSAIEAWRQRFTLCVTRLIVPCMFSIALVQASDRRSSGGKRGRLTVSISSRPSKMLFDTPGAYFSAVTDGD